MTAGDPHYSPVPPDLDAARKRKKSAQHFPTPPAVARELLMLANLSRGDIVLEPSAGTGALAAKITEAEAAVDCVEIEPGYADVIREAGYARNVTAGDFLSIPPDPVYSKVIMNPPFGRGTFAAHVDHALKFVRPGGRLATVLPASILNDAWNTTSNRALTARLRELIKNKGQTGSITAGAFTASGTPVETVCAVIPVPALPRLPGDGIRRVTIDRTADGEHWDPLTAAPGRYVYYSAFEGQDVKVSDGGECVGCGVLTWTRPDGQLSPLGALGDRILRPVHVTVPAEDGTEQRSGTFPRCWRCENEEDRRERADAAARARLSGAPVRSSAAPSAAPGPRQNPAARRSRRHRPPRSPPGAVSRS